jgi:hypothetical protein
LTTERIETMTEFRQALLHGNRKLGGILEVLDIRLRRLEDQAGIPMPEELAAVRKLYGGKA